MCQLVFIRTHSALHCVNSLCINLLQRTFENVPHATERGRRRNRERPRRSRSLASRPWQPRRWPRASQGALPGAGTSAPGPVAWSPACPSPSPCPTAPQPLELSCFQHQTRWSAWGKGVSTFHFVLCCSKPPWGPWDIWLTFCKNTVNKECVQQRAKGTLKRQEVVSTGKRLELLGVTHVIEES